MKISQIIESRDMCNVCGQTPCNCTHVMESLNEFAPASNPGGGNYLKALASAWYNGTFNTGDLHKGIKSQEDVEKILARGIHCGDGKVRKYEIGYNSDFDGVLITSDDYYNYSDYDDAGNEVDERTGKPWGPYEYVEFDGNELDESIAEDQLDEKWSQKYKNSINCSNPKGFSQRAHCQGKRK